MDFGVVGLDHGAGFSANISSSSDPETKPKTLYGSGFSNKQERSEEDSTALDGYYWRSSKLSKSSSNGDEADFLASKTALQQRNSGLLRSNTGLGFLDNGQPQQQMLSFSSPKSEAFSVDRSSQNAILPYFPNALSAYNSRNITGFNSGSFVNDVNMHGGKGPFTPSQWMELEQQALIYKYLTANVPIPSNLLIPIKKAFDSAGFSSFPAGLLRTNALGWGSFHLGFSNNADPEPGRCRRTDGKKWRCSRDAVADQKYCERHINRGRHRSRKPVEGQTGHAVAGATVAASATTAANSSSVVTMPGGGASNSLAVANNRQQIQSLDMGASNSSVATAHMNRMFVKENVGERIQSTPGGLSLLPKENSLFMARKPHQVAYDGSARPEFGLVTSDSLLNPTSQKTIESQHSLGQFMDAQWDRTQLSISIPDMPQASSDFNSETNLSPLRLSREQETPSTNPHHRQANWIPISWEASLGGPLGEVLHHTNNITSSADCKRSSSSTTSVLNLMTEGWDTSPPMVSSPTGVLQKTAFGSLSNSSAGSSPRTDNNKALEGASLCNDLLGSAHLNSHSSLPAL